MNNNSKMHRKIDMNNSLTAVIKRNFNEWKSQTDIFVQQQLTTTKKRLSRAKPEVALSKNQNNNYTTNTNNNKYSNNRSSNLPSAQCRVCRRSTSSVLCWDTVQLMHQSDATGSRRSQLSEPSYLPTMPDPGGSRRLSVYQHRPTKGTKNQSVS